MNKKGLAPVLAMFFGLFIVLAVASFFFYLRIDIETFVGDHPLGLVKGYQETEKDLIAADQASKFSVHRSILDLAANGGYSKAPVCGELLDYRLWNGKDICIPGKADLESGIGSFIDNNLASYKLFESSKPGEFSYAVNSEADSLQVVGISSRPIKPFIPTITNTLTEEQIEQSVKGSPLAGLGKCIKEAEQRSNVPAILILAVAWLESGKGESGLASGKCLVSLGNPPNKDSYNLFGYKTTATEKGTTGGCIWLTKECFTESEETGASKEGKLISCSADLNYGCEADGKQSCQIKDEFRSYHNMCESVNDFVDLINKPRYKGSLQYADKPDQMAREIKNAGYSTARWADGVIGVMRSIQNKAGIVSAEAPQEKKALFSANLATPSFNHKIAYSFDEYSELAKKIPSLIESSASCVGSADANRCIRNKLSALQDSKFRYDIGCEEGNERILADFAEFYQDCLSSADDDCTCSFGPEGNADILLENKDRQGKQTQLTLGRSYVIDVTGPLLLQDGSRVPRDSYTVSTNTKIIVHKQRNTLAFTSTEGSKKCAVNKRVFRFCATSNTYKVIGYNDKSLKAEFMPVKYKFALSLEKKNPPPPVVNLTTADKEKAEHSVLLYWNESTDASVRDYSVFIQGTDFQPSAGNLKSLEGLKSSREIVVTEIPDSRIFKELSAERPFEIVRRDGKLTYKVLSKDGTVKDDLEFEKETAYYLLPAKEGETGKIVYAVDELEDGKDYYFAVLATDVFGNKDLKAYSGYSKSVDDLAPGKPTVLSGSKQGNDYVFDIVASSFNEDGSALDASEPLSMSYYAESPKDGKCDVDVSAGEIGRLLNFKKPQDTIRVSSVSGTLCWAFVARDEMDNPKSSDDAKLLAGRWEGTVG